MALVTWTCGHKSRIIGTEKSKAKYMVCRECYINDQSEAVTDGTEGEIEQMEAAADMSEIQTY